MLRLTDRVILLIGGVLLWFCAGAWNLASATNEVLWLKLDETDGAYAIDSSDYEHNGTLWKGANIVTGVWVSGKVDGALDFGVTNYDYLSVGNVGVNTDAGEYNTMAFWVKWNGTDCNGPGLKYDDGMTYCLKFSSGSFGFTTANGDLLGISSSGFSNQWVHVAAVFPNGVPNAGNAKLYINGVAQTLTYLQGTVSASQSASSTILVMLFKGVIDELRVYDRALTATEATLLANPPVLWLKMDETNGIYAMDSSGYGHNGTLANGPAWTSSGKVGGALDSDGSDDYVAAEDVAISSAAGGCNTVAFWMNWNGGDNQMPFGWDGPYGLWFSDGSFGINTGENNILGIASAGLSNQWVHVAAMFTNGVPSASDSKIYINGVAQTLTQRKGATTQSQTATPEVFVSGWGHDAEHKFGGAIDDVRVYDHELTESEVELVSAAQPLRCIFSSQSQTIFQREETVSDPFLSQVEGTNFNIVVEELSDGPYAVELGVASPAAIVTNDIGFDVTSPEGEVLFSYQPGKQGGPWWSIPVTSVNDRIDLHFESQERCNAWLNALRLYNGTNLLAEFNLGFDTNDEAYFSDTDRVNLAPNPGFEVFSDSGQPIGWQVVTGSATNIASDQNIAHGGSRALRIVVQSEPLEMETATRQFWSVDTNDHYGAAIDYNRNYTFSAWVRGSNSLSSNVRLDMAWLRIRGELVVATNSGHIYTNWSNAHTVDTLEPAHSQDFSITSGEWQQVKLSATPPSGASHVFLRVVAWGEGNVWLDDLRLDGFGNAPLEIIACQGGFHPAGVKKVIVATTNNVPSGGSFTLYPSGTQSPVYTKALVSWGADEWGRNIWIADFTDFTTEGDYELEASLPGLAAEKSHAFSISRRHYKDLIDKVRHYLYVARCGTAISGWHDACHLDDAMDGTDHYDMTGGWHDAGSLDKQMGSAAILIRYLSTIALEAPTNYPSVTVGGLALPEVLDETIWGADQLLKMQCTNGSFFASVNPSTNGDIVTSQNGISGDYDDRPLVGPYPAWPKYIIGLTKPALALQSRGQDYTRFLNALNVSYPVMVDNATNQALLVDVDMWRLTTNQVYRENADTRAAQYLGILENRDYYRQTPDYYLLDSLTEYALAFPTNSLTADIKAEVRAFIDEVLDPFVRRTPYEHVANWNLLFPHTIGGEGSATTAHNLSNYETITRSACFIVNAYRLLGEQRCLDIADAQLQWIMGRNPMNNSMIAGVGHRFQMPSTAISYTCPAHADGLITGAVLHYALDGNGKLVTYYSGGLPRWFPVIYPSSDISGHMLSGGEIWNPVSAMFMRACYELDQAIRLWPVIGWWKFDETSGITAADASGHTNNATGVNNPTWVAGNVSNAVSLKAVSNQYLTVADNASFNYTNGLTISTWLKINSLPGDHGGGIWSDIDSTSKNGVIVYMNPTGTIQFQVGDANDYTALTNTNVIPTRQWYHVACTYDNSVMKIYINGALTATSSCSRVITDNTQTKLIGKTGWGEYYVDGYLDDLRVYETALNSNEVAELAGIGGTNYIPVALNDSYTTAEDTPLTVSAPGVLGNDTDLDEDALTAAKVSDPANGTLVLSTNGSFTYTPNANWNGTDTFTYRASDGRTNSNTATVTITVTPVNDAPTCSISSPTNGTVFSAPATITINANAADIDGTITSVEFYNGATKLGGDTTSPYSYIWANVDAGSYSLTAKATDNNGAVTASAVVNVTSKIFSPPPTASKGAYADKVMVYWDTASYAISYKVWRGTSGNAQTASVIGTSTASLYLDTSATPDVLYYYWIQVVTATGVSELSLPDSGYCGSIANLTSPTGLQASDGSYTDRIRITWQAVNSATRYEVWRNTGNGLSAASLISEPTETSYDDYSISPGIYYYYWVKAGTAHRDGDFSDFDAGWCRLSNPAGVSASNGSYPYHIRVVWNAVANAAWYEVWREDAPNGGNLAKVAQTGDVYFNDYYTKSGAYYSYKVKAYNDLCSSLDYGHDTGYRQVNAASALLFVINDYDGDKLSDLALFNPLSGVMDVLCSALGRQTFVLGAEHGQGVTGDYDGDRLTDPVAYCPDSGLWLVSLSSIGYNPIIQAHFDGNGNDPVTADFDGDGLTDLGVYNETDGVLSAMLSNGGAFDIRISCLIGGPGYRFVSADFDGDGLADPTIYSESESRVIIFFSGSGYFPVSVALGGQGISMYASDFDGDKLDDPVLYEAATGIWTIFLSSTGYSWVNILFGGPEYVPIVGDYDGDGLGDPAIYRETDGQWLIIFSASGYSVIVETFGGPEYQPLMK